MSNNNIDPSQTIKEELSKAIKKRSFYEFWDLRLAHFFLWFSVIASFTSAIVIASGDVQIPKIWIAVIAGIPGLVVVIERTFDFSKRSAWGTIFKIELQEVQDDLLFGKIDSYTASRKLREISQRNEILFLRIGSFVNKDSIEPEGNANIEANPESKPK